MENTENEDTKELNETFNKRKEKIIQWFKDPYNLTLSIILIFAFAIRLYYFILTKNQPLWYDEAEYMSGGLNWAFGVPYQFNVQRPILFHFLIFLLMRFGFNESLIKFVLSVIPSILVVPLSYVLVKDMYNKKIALITSLIFSFFWLSIFYSMRIMTDIFGFLLGLFAFYLFWEGYVEKKNKYYVWLMGVFIALPIMIRLAGAMFGLILLLFLIFTERLKFLKNRDLWIAFFIALLTISPFLIWYYNYHGSVFGFLVSNLGQGTAATSDKPFAWNVINFIPAYLYTTFLIMFFVGLLTLMNLILGLDLFFREKKKNLYADFLNVLTILFVLAFFIFYLKGTEDRWLIAISLPLFVFVSKGIMLISNQIEKRLNKSLAILFILVILVLGAYAQIKFANDLIISKKDSYSQVRDAGLWIKENSENTDVVFSYSITQNTYYSQRETFGFSVNETEFLKEVKEKNPKYIVISAFENYPSWATASSENFRNITNPVNAFFFDAEKKQAALIIFENKNYKPNKRVL